MRRPRQHRLARRKDRRLAIVALLAGVLPVVARFATAADWAKPDAPVVAVRCGRIIDGLADTALGSGTILIEGERIVAVGRSKEAPAGARVIDLSEFTCLPGLIDCHTHLTGRPESGGDEAVHLKYSAADVAFRSIDNARKTIEAGFTSVRDVGTYDAFTDVALRDAIERGDVVGPRMQVAGFYVTIPGGGGELNSFAPELRLPERLRFGVVSGADAVRRAVREGVGHRVDLIKVIASGAFLALGSVPQLPAFTEKEIRAAVEEVRKSGLKVAAHARGAGWPEEYIKKEEEVSAGRWPWNIARAYRAGVRIAFGTDAAVYPHGQNGRQFPLMVEWLGMKPMEAIKSATSVAADLMGLEDRVGSLAAGRYADVVAVKGDPLRDLHLLESVPFVMKGGAIIKDTRAVP